jgi:hypothetical protein
MLGSGSSIQPLEVPLGTLRLGPDQHTCGDRIKALAGMTMELTNHERYSNYRMWDTIDIYFTTW